MQLLERAEPLEILNRCLQEAASGHGALVFVGGEAGIGKTSLIGQFALEARSTATVATGRCDDLAMPGPFGPFIEIAGQLGPDVERLFGEAMPRDQLSRAFLAALERQKGVIVLVCEDAHWADEASLDLIRYLGRRVSHLPLLVIVTYRDDEIGPYHPFRRILGDLATMPAVRRISLSPLSVDAVAALAIESELDATNLHELTGGNPFFVNEVVAAGRADVPPTVRDAVLARAARLSDEARAVLDAAAAIGMAIDIDLLESVIGGPVEDALDECLAAGVMKSTDGSLAFRHAITRQAILETISLPRYLALQRRILAALQRPAVLRHDLARIAHHAEEARDRDAVLTAAPAAARQAAAFGAHREAADQYARALRFADELPVEERAPLLEARFVECYLTGATDEALSSCRQAVACWSEAGNRLREGNAHRWLSRLCWFTGQTAPANDHAHQALDILEPLPSGPELAMAYSNIAQLRMLSNDTTTAIIWGERAIALAQELGDVPILVHAMANVGSARLLEEDERGYRMLEESLRLARDAGLDDDIARALTNLTWTSLIDGRLELAEGYLAKALAHTGERDLLAMECYLRAISSLLRFAQGAWETAREEAVAVTQQAAATSLTRIVALTTLGRIEAFRGGDPSAYLDEALARAEQTSEFQRIAPVRAARAEAAWLAGDLDRTAHEAWLGYLSAHGHYDRWMAGELAIWLHRAGKGSPLDPSVIAEPFAAEITGEWVESAAQWTALGYSLQAARVAAIAGDEEAVRGALETFHRLGAPPDAGRAVARLRSLGVRVIPRGPRPATRSNAAQLTTRELEVLARLATGDSNREIANQLFLSQKTVGHHVSAILAKLDAATRTEAVERALQLGLLQNRESASPS